MSGGEDAAKPYCEDCQRSAKAEARVAQGGLGCDERYKRVDECMAANRGQVSACAQEWTAFRECRKANKLK